MFRGRFEYTIDAKGRVSIPAKFRELLAEKYDDRLILTNFDRCLVAYPYEEWRVLEDKVSSLSMVKKEAKAFQRFFICDCQRQGKTSGRRFSPADGFFTLRDHERPAAGPRFLRRRPEPEDRRPDPLADEGHSQWQAFGRELRARDGRFRNAS